MSKIGLIERVKRIVKFILKNSEPIQSAPFLIRSEQKINSFGKESYHNGNFIVKGSSGKLNIGSYCAIGQDVKVILSNHDLSNICMQYTFYRKNFNINPISDKYMETTIENDVWIGDNVIILPGVKIGTGAVLAAGAIVTKDVDDYCIVGGNPAKLIRKRFTEEKIKMLVDSKWWEWDKEKIAENKDFFGVK
nr:CatB-related O-acetyltransferase [Soonwooa sp.]